MASESEFRFQTSTFERTVNSELTCGVCLELYTSPVMLPCSHNFCKECVNGIIDANLSTLDIFCGPPSGFHCPLCHRSIQITKYQFNQWPVNRALENIVNLYKKSAPCEIFDDSWYRDLEPTIGKCERHDKLLDKFCDSCTEVICCICEKTDHSSERAIHRVEPVEHAVRAYQTDIANSLTDLKKKLIPLNNQMNQLDALSTEIQVKADHLKKQMDEKFSQLMSLTRAKQTDLMQKINADVAEHTRPITNDLNRCRSVHNTVEDLISKLSHIRRIKNTTLLLQSMKNVYKQLDTLIGLDVDQCLRNQIQHTTLSSSYDLHTQDAFTAIENLNWTTTSSRHEDDTRIHSVQTQTDDLAATDTQNSAVDRQGKAEVNKLIVPHSGNASGNSFSSNSSMKPGCSLSQLEARNSLSEHSESGHFDESRSDEPDGDLFESSADVPVIEVVPVQGHSKRKLANLRKDTRNPKNDGNDENDLRKQFDGLDLGDIAPGFKLKGHGDINLTFEVKSQNEDDCIPGLKGRSSLPIDVRDDSRGTNSKTQSSKKRQKAENDTSHSAAIKNFVARRRTMSPSVSTNSLESMSKSLSGEKMTLRPGDARRNVSSPALRSLASSYESINTNGSQQQIERSPSHEVDRAVGVSDVSMTTNHSLSTNSDKVISPDSNSTKPNTSGKSVMHNSKQKSFTSQPIDLNLDLNLDQSRPSSSTITTV